MMFQQTKLLLSAITVVSIFLIGVSCDNLTNPEFTDPIDWQDVPAISEADDSNLSDSVKAAYINSAEELAIQLILETEPDRIDIPENVVQSFYNGLIHIVTSDLEEAEVVTEEFGIHSRPEFARGEILITVDTTAAADWLDSWRNESVETGVDEIDQLITAYEMDLKSYNELSSQSNAMAVLKTDQLINPVPVADEFSRVPELSDAGMNSLVGDGGTIDIAIDPGAILFRFEHGWGDCPAGCINSHYWIFNVDTDGDVQFLEEGGNELSAN